MGIRENIVKLRNLTGVTQAELGRIAGVSRAAVSLWEIGESEPRMGAVQAMADYFHIRKANIIEDGGMDKIAASATGTLYEIEESGALTLEEREILTMYRACDAQGRKLILDMCHVTAGIYPESADID